MNNTYDCEIIRDLLPGYIDGVLSEAGNRVVREHLDECEACHQIYLEMKEEWDTGITPEEPIALDGLKKVRQHTRKLNIAVGSVTGLLILLLGSIFVKAFVIGEPVSTYQISATRVSYDEKKECLVIEGRADVSSGRIGRVVWKQSGEETDAVNVMVYRMESLPFQQVDTDFSITIPDMKGKKAYLACPSYDQLEVYNWRHDHYELLKEMEEEIYSRFPELDRQKDALSPGAGIQVLEGMDGIYYSVDSVIGDQASYWRSGGHLITDGELKSQNYEIWISLEQPFRIFINDYQTGNVTEWD